MLGEHLQSVFLGQLVSAVSCLVVCVGSNKAQCESFELSFFGGKMRTISWEIASQITMKNCSKEVGGRSAYM